MTLKSAIRIAWSLVLTGACSASAAVTVRGPEDFELLQVRPALPEGCVTRVSPGLYRFSCPLPENARLAFRRPGWEPREVRVSGEALDLRDRGWEPSPWRIQLSPPELAASSQVVWINEGAVAWALTDDQGRVEGPRIPPTSQGVFAVIGPHTAGKLFFGPREPEREPTQLSLNPGKSTALVCREPNQNEILPDCQLVVGEPFTLLGRYGLGTVHKVGRVEGMGGLFLLSNYPDEAVVLAQTRELPPVLLDLKPAETGAVELLLPSAHKLRVELVRRKTGEGVPEGKVRLVAPLRDLLLLEATTGEEGLAELMVGPGRYRVVAEAKGFRRGEREVTVDQPEETLTIDLEPATLLRGQVRDERGQPFAGAMVMAVSQEMRLDGTENLAATGTDGGFEVTAPGAGPWWVWAQAEGVLSEKALVSSPDAPLQLFLFRECLLSVLPVDPSGSFFPVRNLAFLGLDRAAVRLPEATEPSRAVRVRLSPGRWRAVAEAEGAQGYLEVPDACEGLELSVVLAPALKP